MTPPTAGPAVPPGTRGRRRTRCQATSLYLSPSRKVSLKHCTVEALVAGKRIRITDRRQIAQLIEERAWNGLVEISYRDGRREQVTLDPRIVNGHLPSNAAWWRMRQLADGADLAAVGGARQLAEVLFGVRSKPAGEAAAAAIADGRGFHVSVLSAAAAAADIPADHIAAILAEVSTHPSALWWEAVDPADLAAFVDLVGMTETRYRRGIVVEFLTRTPGGITPALARAWAADDALAELVATSGNWVSVLAMVRARQEIGLSCDYGLQLRRRGLLGDCAAGEQDALRAALAIDDGQLTPMAVAAFTNACAEGYRSSLPQERSAVLHAITMVLAHSPQARQLLVDAAADSDPVVRAEAAALVGKLSAVDVEKATRIAMQLAGDGTAIVNDALFSVLGTLGKASPNGALDVLEEMLRSTRARGGQWEDFQDWRYDNEWFTEEQRDYAPLSEIIQRFVVTRPESSELFVLGLTAREDPWLRGEFAAAFPSFAEQNPAAAEAALVAYARQFADRRTRTASVDEMTALAERALPYTPDVATALLCRIAQSYPGGPDPSSDHWYPGAREAEAESYRRVLELMASPGVCERGGRQVLESLLAASLRSADGSGDAYSDGDRWTRALVAGIAATPDGPRYLAMLTANAAPAVRAGTAEPGRVAVLAGMLPHAAAVGGVDAFVDALAEYPPALRHSGNGGPLGAADRLALLRACLATLPAVSDENNDKLQALVERLAVPDYRVWIGDATRTGDTDLLRDVSETVAALSEHLPDLALGIAEAALGALPHDYPHERFRSQVAVDRLRGQSAETLAAFLLAIPASAGEEGAAAERRLRLAVRALDDDMFSDVDEWITGKTRRWASAVLQAGFEADLTGTLTAVMDAHASDGTRAAVKAAVDVNPPAVLAFLETQLQDEPFQALGRFGRDCRLSAAADAVAALAAHGVPVEALVERITDLADAVDGGDPARLGSARKLVHRRLTDHFPVAATTNLATPEQAQLLSAAEGIAARLRGRDPEAAARIDESYLNTIATVTLVDGTGLAAELVAKEGVAGIRRVVTRAAGTLGVGGAPSRTQFVPVASWVAAAAALDPPAAMELAGELSERWPDREADLWRAVGSGIERWVSTSDGRQALVDEEGCGQLADHLRAVRDRAAGTANLLDISERLTTEAVSAPAAHLGATLLAEVLTDTHRGGRLSEAGLSPQLLRASLERRVEHVLTKAPAEACEPLTSAAIDWGAILEDPEVKLRAAAAGIVSSNPVADDVRSIHQRVIGDEGCAERAAAATSLDELLAVSEVFQIDEEVLAAADGVAVPREAFGESPTGVPAPAEPLRVSVISSKTDLLRNASKMGNCTAGLAEHLNHGEVLLALHTEGDRPRYNVHLVPTPEGWVVREVKAGDNRETPECAPIGEWAASLLRAGAPASGVAGAPV